MQQVNRPPELAALAFEDVSFSYHQQQEIVHQVSLTIAQGEMVGLLGPNGAGKSTVLKLASGVLSPSAGTVRIASKSIHELTRDEIARRVAVVPQEFSVQFAYTVQQIVDLGRMPHRGAWGIARGGDREAVISALQATDTEGLADRIFNELSGGERQRVLLALALAQQTDIMLLDEPTAHLDIKHQIELLALLQRMNRERGITVVAALHDLNLAARYFGRLVLFRREVVADGPPGHVLNGRLLSDVYETPVQVGILRGEEHLSILPPGALRVPVSIRPSASLTYPTAHIIAGGGSGELLMRALADASIAFTAGPLNVGDSDCVLAERLASHCIVEPPYAPVSPEGIAALRDRLSSAAAIVVCAMPVGHGNVAILEAALDASRSGQPVLLLEPALSAAHDPDAACADQQCTAKLSEIIASRDFSGSGVALYADLVAAGAKVVASDAEVLACLSAIGT